MSFAQKITSLIIATLFFTYITPCYAIYKESYQEADERAKNVPATYERSLSKLVSYLTQPFANNDELKARVLFAWIAYHIEYDAYKRDVIVGDKRPHSTRSVSSGDIFETRVGVCSDIANLFLRMANKADLKAEIVTGWAGDSLTKKDYSKNPHAWNAVLINRKWQLIDPTWGLYGDYMAFSQVQNAREHRSQLRERRKNKQNTVSQNRSINSDWFLVPPEEMIQTHIPRQEKWQLLRPAKKLNALLK